MAALESMGKFLSEHHWGDIASVFGVIISVVGFAVTIWGVLRSKKAAKMAQEAAVKARDAVLRLDVLTEIPAAIAIMEEIKRLHRITGSRRLLPDRYTSVNQKLSAIKNSRPRLPQEYVDALQLAIQQFRSMEEQNETKVPRKKGTAAAEALGPEVLNKIVSEQIDKLNEILSVVRTGMDMGTYDKR
jgi:hypothetical protein